MCGSGICSPWTWGLWCRGERTAQRRDVLRQLHLPNAPAFGREAETEGVPRFGRSEGSASGSSAGQGLEGGGSALGLGGGLFTSACQNGAASRESSSASGSCRRWWALAAVQPR